MIGAVKQLMGGHADPKRTEMCARDSRIFPGWYVPVLVWEERKHMVKPMRYGCRPAGKPAFYDVAYPGTYNARRDLERFWKNQIGRTHGLILVNAFYENVNRHRVEGRELASGEEVEDLVLEFRPRPTQDMLLESLWSKWSGSGGPDLLFFGAITDEPPAEVAAAGQDRCVVPIKPENVDAWLDPARGVPWSSSNSLTAASTASAACCVSAVVTLQTAARQQGDFLVEDRIGVVQHRFRRSAPQHAFGACREQLIALIRLKFIGPPDPHTSSDDVQQMTMFRHRQQLRRWAARVLLLWLFGIGAGVANACIATAPAAAAVSHIVAVVDAHHDVVSHNHAQAASAGLPSQSTDAPAHLGNLSKANCQDFCDKASVSIPPLKSALDDIQSHPVIAMTAMTVLPMPAFAPVQLRVPRRDGVQAPPISIAFLRLAL